MVRSFKRLGLAIKFHCFSLSRSKTFFAKLQRANSCGDRGGSLVFSAKVNAEITRSFISEAAFLVNVIAKIFSGRLTTDSKAKIRWVNNSVFPEPAGACTIYDSDTLNNSSRTS